jgi:RNA polymerase sigma-70 factor (ECF subfamily)
MDAREEVTGLLAEINQGDRSAVERLMPLVYDELRRIAARYFARERGDHTLQPTAVVHEAFLRLVDQRVEWKNRAHFLGVASTMMRRVLLDYAKAKQAGRRMGQKISLEEGVAVSEDRLADVVAIDDALARLEGLDAEQARVVEMRFFGGLSVEETAQALAISPRTVKRHWASARAWLYREMSR